MGRYYHLSKKISKRQSDKILKEMKELDDVDIVSISKNQSELLVITKDDVFSEVMCKAVNICSRTAGVELTFEKFAV